MTDQTVSEQAANTADTAAVQATPAVAEEVKEGAAGTKGKTVKARGKKSKKAVPRGKVFINATYNNTLISVTDANGNVIAWASAGNCGFKGAKKSTPYAAQVAAEKAMGNAENYGLNEVDVYVKGVGTGRDQAVRGVIAKGNVTILSINDITPIPHGGCRKKKVRRV